MRVYQGNLKQLRRDGRWLVAELLFLMSATTAVTVIKGFTVAQPMWAFAAVMISLTMFVGITSYLFDTFKALRIWRLAQALGLTYDTVEEAIVTHKLAFKQRRYWELEPWTREGFLGELKRKRRLTDWLAGTDGPNPFYCEWPRAA